MEKYSKISQPHEEWMKQTEHETEILAEPFSEKSLDDLYIVRDILNKRLNKNNSNENKIPAIKFGEGISSDQQTVKIADDISIVFKMFKNNKETYLEELLIVEGIIKAKESSK